MKALPRRNITVFLVTMICTLLIILSICCMFLVFRNTSSAVFGDDYSQFLLIPNGDASFQLHAFGKEYLVDYSPALDVFNHIKGYFTFIPSGLRFAIQIFGHVKDFLFSLL